MRKILIIEDDPDSANMLGMLLQFQGHAVTSVATGQAGLALAGTYRPDVVIVDLVLPDMDGLDVIRALAAPEVDIRPIVALTGQADPQLRRQSEEAGADYFFTKSEEISALLALIDQDTLD